MKKKTRELQRLSEAELESKLAELRKELMRQNAQLATGTIPKNPGMIKQTKKEIARILMFIDALGNSGVSGATRSHMASHKTKEERKQE